MKSTEPIYYTDADRQEMIHIAQGTERFFLQTEEPSAVFDNEGAYDEDPKETGSCAHV